jgi:hypothetical protein
VHLASVAVRHIRRGRSPGTRTAGRFEEVSVPARRVLSSECQRPHKSNPKAAHPILAWYALRQAGVHAPVNGYGRVFTK